MSTHVPIHAGCESVTVLQPERHVKFQVER